MFFRCLLFLLLQVFSVNAQLQKTDLIKELVESLAEGLPEDYDLSQLESQLIYFTKHPINLNHTTSEELKTLLLLSPLQISNLFQHLSTNGKLIAVLELQAIPTFDTLTVQNILPFVTINAVDLAEEISYQNLRTLGENDLVVRIGKTLQQQKGFTNLLGNRYIGSQERFLFRYKYNYANRVSASFIIEKDAGEKFLGGNKQFLFDYQSGHIGLYNMGRFKKIVVGDYTLQFGQGLTLWSGFAFGKAPDVASMAKRDVGLKAYSSANEYSFFRGIATTLSLQEHLHLTSFFSIRNLDANLNLNNNNEETLATLNETGLHRTTAEIEHKNSIQQKAYGLIMEYQFHTLNIGGIAYQTLFNKAFVTGPEIYRAFNFVGKALTTIGLNYNFTLKNSYFFGEVSRNLSGGMAYLNGVLISLSSKLSTVFLHRSYQRNYHNFYSQGMAEGSSTMNESGFYAGINIYPKKEWILSFYADCFRFPWLKFRVDAPSNGYEILGQITYAPIKSIKAILSYKTETKSQNTAEEVPISYLEPVNKKSYRADVNWQLDKSVKLQTRLEFSQFKKGPAEAEFGLLVYQDVSYSPPFSKISGNIRLAYFNTASYNSRIYAYEDDILYNFSFGQYSGKGYRTIINLKYKILKNLDLWARFALFYYPDQTSVGSGLDEISGSSKADAKLQLRYQL